MGALSRRKGHSFERDIARQLRDIFPMARRQLEYNVMDCNGVDIQGTGHYKIQCKREKRYSPINRIEEIEYNATIGEIPVLVTQADRKPVMAVIPWDDFLDILRQLHGDK